MCDCLNPSDPPQTDLNSVTRVYNQNECRGITIDLLQMYLRPIECYIKYGLYENIQSTQLELQNAQTYLENYIAAKQADPETCEYREQLPIVQTIVNRIISAGICL